MDTTNAIILDVPVPLGELASVEVVPIASLKPGVSARLDLTTRLRREEPSGQNSDSLPVAALLGGFRKAAALTQEELAAKSGISVRSISALERSRTRYPHFHTIKALARALCLTKSQEAELVRAARPT